MFPNAFVDRYRGVTVGLSASGKEQNFAAAILLTVAICSTRSLWPVVCNVHTASTCEAFPSYSYVIIGPKTAGATQRHRDTCQQFLPSVSCYADDRTVVLVVAAMIVTPPGVYLSSSTFLPSSSFFLTILGKALH